MLIYTHVNDKDKRCRRAKHETGRTSEFFVSQDVEFYKASSVENIGYYDPTVSIRRLCMKTSNLQALHCFYLFLLICFLKKLSVAK